MTAWWLALPVLAAIGLAVRGRRTPPTALPSACAVTAAIPYLFLIGYAAPRFLLPTYALLAIPVADALARLVTALSRAWRPVTVTLVALGLTGHLAVQYAVLAHTIQRTTAAHKDWERTAAALAERVYARRVCSPGRRPSRSPSTRGSPPPAPRAPTPASTPRPSPGRPTGCRSPSYSCGWALVRLDGAVYAYIAPIS